VKNAIILLLSDNNLYQHLFIVGSVGFIGDDAQHAWINQHHSHINLSHRRIISVINDENHQPIVTAWERFQWVRGVFAPR
jgi:hypothetical protein